MVLKEGELLQSSAAFKIPLQTVDGQATSLEQLDILGRKPLVLFHYPKAHTGGCTKEVCAFRDDYEVFKQAGAEVIGFSGDQPEANASFSRDQRLTFPLLCDSKGELRKALGIKGNLFGMVPGRQTFVFDNTGKCILSFNSALNFKKHVEESKRVIQELAQKQKA